MEIDRRHVLLYGLLAPAGLRTAARSTFVAGLAPAAAGTVDLVRMGWAGIGPPTPFRISTAGPGGPVLLTLIYDMLTWKDAHGIIPWLAAKWTISPDGLIYTFTLDPAAQWQDGQPLTAADVAFSFDYYGQHPYRWMSTAMVASATVVGQNQVRVTLKQPYAPFLEDVAGTVPILPKHIWSQVSDPMTYGGAGASLGSGPFKLVKYDSAAGNYQLAANPTSFGGTVNVRQFEQLNVPAATQIQAVQHGDLDLAMTTDTTVGKALSSSSHLKVFPTPPESVVRLAVNTTRPPVNQQAVRQAIMYALNRAQIAQVVTKGPPIVGSAGVVPPQSPWFDPNLPAYPYDPAKARALLKGKTDTIELIADPTNREPELMAPMLKAVGITLVTKRVDSNTRTELLREGNFQLGIVQHIGISGDPDYLRRWYAGAEANDYAQGSIFHDPQYDQLGHEEAATVDVARRKALIFQMQAILAAQLPTIPLYYRRFYWVYDSTKLTPMNTWGGLINGAPLVDNKLIFLQR